MTELSFLIDLLLNHKLPKLTRDAVATRIKDVECRASQQQVSSSPRLPSSSPASSSLPPHIANQAPSMQAIMMRNQDLVSTQQVAPPREDEHITQETPKPVDVIAQTPAAVAAMNARQASIAQARSGKPLPGETRPRKF